MTDAALEWISWNPVTGCTHVSEGCRHCYAERFAERWRGIAGHHYERGFDLQLRPARLELPPALEEAASRLRRFDERPLP